MELINYEWYLLKVIDSYCPSGYCIAQYIDGLYFDERCETSINDVDIVKTIKHLK